MERFFKNLKDKRLSVKQLYALHALHTQGTFAIHTDVPKSLGLIDLGLVNNSRTLTPEGIEILNSFQDLFIKSKTRRKKPSLTAEEKTYVAMFRELFPKGRPANHKQPVRVNVKELESRFIQFRQDYPDYTWNTILAATKLYIEDSSKENHSHLQVCKNFIYKTDVHKRITSNLASYCDMILNEESDIDNAELPSFYSIKVR